jgi:hypothetical protein
MRFYRFIFAFLLVAFFSLPFALIVLNWNNSSSSSTKKFSFKESLEIQKMINSIK